MKQYKYMAIFLVTIILAWGVIQSTYSGVAERITLGLDLQGGFEILYQVQPIKEMQVINKDLLIHTQAALQKRVDVIGVSEPEFSIEGEDRIRVKLAGVTDQNQARRLLSTEAQLSFRDVNDRFLMGGDNIREGSARVQFNELNQPHVAIEFVDTELARSVTASLLQQPMVIWLDWEEGDHFIEEVNKPNPKFISAPTVQNVLSTNGIITGQFTYAEAKELADLLNAGALPVVLEELSANSVGAKLGERAMELTVRAGLIGGILIALYMVTFYRLTGLVASLTLVAYVYLILLVFGWMEATLTLPGIAALVLGIGMAVDANILTAERMKEEIRAGKTILSAFRLGTRRALGTILDANVTTVIAAALLFAFGTSAIQGFAVMLITSIILSIMTAVFGARLLLGLLLRSRLFDQKPHWFGVSKDQITKLGTDQERAPLYHFIGTRHKVFTGTALVLGIGILLFALFGFHAGVDFTGGTQLEIENQGVLNAELIRNELAQFEVIPSEMRQVGNDNELTRILFNETLSSIQIEEMMSQLGNQYNLEMSYSETTVSADIARELARKALWAVLFASVGIIAYVAVRFEYSMGLAAVITIFHDALIVLAVFTIFRIQVDLTFVAAILTVVGYSINDTIVLFDRIREKLRQKKIKDARHLVKLVNVSITEVLPRSIHTTVTLLIAVLALLLLGGEGIRNFSMALCIGLLTGAWSSIFIAAPLWVFFKERKELKENKLIKAA